MNYKITIEPDNDIKGLWMVVIRGDRLVGIPLRGVSKIGAESHQQALAFAFEYGLKEARERIEAVQRKINFVVD